MADMLELPDDLVAWIESVAGGALRSARRMAGGGRKQAWFIDVDGADGVRELFVRWDPSPPSSRRDPWTVHREAAYYRALGGTGLPVAELVALHPTEQAMVLTRQAGQAWFSRLVDETERERVAAEFMTHLADLHRLDPRQLGLADRAMCVPDLVDEQLDEIDGVIEARGGSVEPLLALALHWLRRHIPGYTGPAVVVQGDTGPGNFMFHEGRVTAIVDWELAHLGDPMDDLAWVSLRAVQEPFTDLRQRFAEYEQRSGHRLDPARIRYYRVLAEAKILAMGHGVTIVRTAGGGGDPGAGLIFGQLHRRLCAEALAEVTGVELDPPAPLADRATTEDDRLFVAVLDQLRDVVTPRVTDSFANQRIKGLARALKYLAAASRHRDEVDVAELADLRDVLGAGADAADLATAREAFADAVRAGRLPFAVALRTIHRQLLRRNELLRASSGALADRHYDPLDR